MNNEFHKQYFIPTQLNTTQEIILFYSIKYYSRDYYCCYYIFVQIVVICIELSKIKANMKLLQILDRIILTFGLKEINEKQIWNWYKQICNLKFHIKGPLKMNAKIYKYTIFNHTRLTYNCSIKRKLFALSHSHFAYAKFNLRDLPVESIIINK